MASSSTAVVISQEIFSTDSSLPSSSTIPTKTTSSPQYLSSTPSTPSTPTTTTTTSSSSSSSNDYLPTNVCTVEQLNDLPVECLSYVDPNRPLKHVSEDGTTISTYSLTPLSYSVVYILLVEVLERFSFYSINYTQTSYLTGQYNPNWNAQMDSITASSYVSISIAIAYTAPFIGAILGDVVAGEYNSILFASVCLYWPGLVLIASTTFPIHIFNYYEQGTFNKTALSIGLLFLFPVGSGIVKSVVNIFGAKQFHPLLQSSLIEAYYVNFYMCINVGALVGGIVVPTIAAQTSVTIAYLLPVCMMFLGICIFLSGTSRYVRNPPRGKAIVTTTTTPTPFVQLFKKFMSPNKTTSSTSSKKKKNATSTKTSTKYGTSGFARTTMSSSEKKITTFQLFGVFLLIVPFCIVYSQMPTTFILQGTVMKKALGGYVDAAIMYNNDTLSVLVFGYIIGSILYPYLATQNVKIPTTYKFAIGSLFGSIAIAWALYIDTMIRTSYYTNNGQPITIVYQALSYILLGIGEIFAISSAYEVAFTASPPEKKVLSSALNIFCIGGIPNIINIGLYHVCSPWFVSTRTGMTNISHLDDYVTARIDKYFVVLLCISWIGIIINILPPVRRYVESIETISIDLLKTPKTPMIRPPRRRHRDFSSENDEDDENENYDDDDDDDDEEEEQRLLLEQKRHEYYLKYGSDRTLYHANSMRAGPSASLHTKTSVLETQQQANHDQHQQQQQQQHHGHGIKKTTIKTLYHINDSHNNDNNKINNKNNKSNNIHDNNTTNDDSGVDTEIRKDHILYEGRGAGKYKPSNNNNNFVVVSVNGKPVSEWKPTKRLESA